MGKVQRSGRDRRNCQPCWGEEENKAGLVGSTSELGPPSAMCGQARQAFWARGQLRRGAGKIDRSHGHGLRQDVHRERNPRHFLLVCLTHLAGAKGWLHRVKAKQNRKALIQKRKASQIHDSQLRPGTRQALP